ncbi:hypothetical protein GE118_01145 [Mycoplasma sp. NEAQ87857]|uniref:MSC_0882 family membrane protein n=1 Tax=Mycoplasma sp. NEAQ87857 TaxID=2683967 RepID=UPI001317DA45|nr:hypothetical protein [Mycoplasma sp. NEAQ87857]QGZ97399.1 hypothetical protein GE118_01145 [Mycoplasma sp. NEAQ87857]
MFKAKMPHDQQVEAIENNSLEVNELLKTQEHTYFDKNNQINSDLYSTLVRERKIRLFSILVYLTFFIGSIVAGVINFVLNTKKVVIDNDKSASLGIGWYVLIGAALLISLVFLIKNILKYKNLNATERKIRQNIEHKDTPTYSVFYEIYQGIVFKKLRLNWLFLFFITYFGLFTLLIFLLKDQHIVIGKEGTSGAFNFFLDIKFHNVFDKWFGNVEVLAYSLLGVIGGVSLLFTIFKIYDLKRLNALKNHLSGEVAANFFATIEASKKQENRAWLKTYIIIFVLVVLLPLALILFLIYKKVIRRK